MEMFSCGYFLGLLTVLIGGVAYNIALDWRASRENKRKKKFLNNLTVSCMLVNGQQQKRGRK